MKSVVFMGSKPIGYHCFKYLIENTNMLGISISSVLTNDNRRFDTSLSLSELAEDNNISVVSIRSVTIRSALDISNHIVSVINFLHKN